jgi:crossover junction endodeoxyribonuclease RuvC
MIVIGIDPGLSGALAAVDADGQLLGCVDTPTAKLRPNSSKRAYMPREMARALRDLITRTAGHVDGVRIYIEAQQAMPKQGVSSTFATGRGYGLWEGLLVGMGLSYTVVRAQQWQRAMLFGAPGEGKMKSMLRAEQLYPDLILTRPSGVKLVMDGRADAALIAAYGQRQLSNV